MNFLAHLYLSGTDPEIMVGNFMGDFVKGSDVLKTYTPAIAKGITLHRGIDHFTDTHPVVLESKKKLRPKYRHYSGVIVDMFYDHFLASGWADYHPDPLAVFATHSYVVLQQHEIVLPERAKRVLPYIVQGNWLVSYASVNGIHRALSGMARRTTHASKMDEAYIDLELNYNEFKKEFTEFFPDLQQWVIEALEKPGTSSI